MGDKIAEVAGRAAGLIFGYLFCLSLLCTAYGLGVMLAGWIGKINPDMLGLLSVITVIWLYEHERANRRWADRQ